jgi:hypothetical protein
LWALVSTNWGIDGSVIGRFSGTTAGFIFWYINILYLIYPAGTDKAPFIEVFFGLR